MKKSLQEYTVEELKRLSGDELTWATMLARGLEYSKDEDGTERLRTKPFRDMHLMGITEVCAEAKPPQWDGQRQMPRIQWVPFSLHELMSTMCMALEDGVRFHVRGKHVNHCRLLLSLQTPNGEVTVENNSHLLEMVYSAYCIWKLTRET